MQIWICSGTEVQPPIFVNLWDLSERGIGLVHSEKLHRNTQFLVNVPGTSDFRLLYSIIRCRMAGDGAYILGAQFLTRVPTEVDAQIETLEKFRKIAA